MFYIMHKYHATTKNNAKFRELSDFYRIEYPDFRKPQV